jgi:hypothetical protein
MFYFASADLDTWGTPKLNKVLVVVRAPQGYTVVQAPQVGGAWSDGTPWTPPSASPDHM